MTSFTEPLHGIVCETRKRSGLRLTGSHSGKICYLAEMERVGNVKLVFLLQIGQCSRCVGL